MKRRGWLIAIGLVLLWLSPLFYKIIKESYFTEKPDYSLYHKAYLAQSEAKRLEALRRGPPSYVYGDRWWKHEGQPARPEVEVVYVDRPVVTERVVYVDAPAQTSQRPNLSGFYFNFPMTGPNVGDVNINYVNGPE